MKILVAIDGSASGKAAASVAGSMFAGKKDTVLKFVCAYETPAAIAAEPFLVPANVFQEVAEMERAKAESSAASAAREFGAGDEAPQQQLSTCVAHGRPASVIIDVAAEWDADVIVVGSHGRGLWRRAALGSVSEAVVHHAPCSVLVVRPQTDNE